MKIYQKIWIDKFGQIPIDEYGKKYHIHHIDGNHSNNCIENLKCVSVQEHYNIHLEQKDYAACLMLSRFLNLTQEEISNLSKKRAQKQIAEGKHPWHDSEKQRNLSIKRIENGTHNFLNSEFQRKVQLDRINSGTHNFQLAIKEGTHATQKHRICPYCFQEGKGPAMIRWHFDNCKKRILNE